MAQLSSCYVMYPLNSTIETPLSHMGFSAAGKADAGGGLQSLRPVVSEKLEVPSERVGAL